jgi:hypothetical protein
MSMAGDCCSPRSPFEPAPLSDLTGKSSAPAPRSQPKDCTVAQARQTSLKPGRRDTDAAPTHPNLPMSARVDRVSRAGNEAHSLPVTWRR